MFRAVLLGCWHDVSDEDLEEMLRVRIDFAQFCGLTLSENVPDRATIQRFRARLIEKNLLEKCLKVINQELERLGLKVENKGSFIIDSTLIKAQARPRNLITVDDTGSPGTGNEGKEEITKSTSADPDARWVKKNKTFIYGYKEQHAVDEDGYVEAVHITPANKSDVTEFKPIVDKLPKNTKKIAADKGYASQENRTYLKDKNIEDNIMHKAQRNSPLSDEQKDRNKEISKIRYVTEQTFGIKKLHFKYQKTRYLGTLRVFAQSIMKSICVNLLKAARKLQAAVA